MVKIYQQAFAHAGLRQVIPDLSDPEGLVSNEDGFTSDYELPDTDPNYKPIERAEFNGLMNMITESLGEIQQFGFAKWQPLDKGWPKNARVVHGEAVYRSAAAGNRATPPAAPWVEERDSFLTSDITLTVGNGGDFSTINEALAYAWKKWYPIYIDTGITVKIHLRAGFVMAEQVLVHGLNMGWITITGVDAETVIDRSALTIDFTTTDYNIPTFPAFGVSKGGTLPRIGKLFNMNSNGANTNRHGVVAVGAGSSADILTFCGVKNAGVNGIYAYDGSTINANSANASGAGRYGIYADDGSTINASLANASGAGVNGIYAYDGSTINASLANASGAGSRGIYADSSSTINANSANASGAGDNGIYADDGSTINARGANARIGASSSSSDIAVGRGGIINAYQSNGDTNITVNTLTPRGIIFK